MNAAIYARKSTEQNVAEEVKSVTRQVENAKAYAAKKGWPISDDHIYIDDGISGAEFDKRPGLSQLRSLLDRRAPFGVLIVSAQKSLGREMNETAWVIKQLDEAGCEDGAIPGQVSDTPERARQDYVERAGLLRREPS